MELPSTPLYSDTPRSPGEVFTNSPKTPNEISTNFPPPPPHGEAQPNFLAELKKTKKVRPLIP